jgi:hypothetical protein
MTMLSFSIGCQQGLGRHVGAYHTVGENGTAGVRTSFPNTHTEVDPEFSLSSLIPWQQATTAP